MSAKLNIDVGGFEKRLELIGEFADRLEAVKSAIVHESYAVNEKVVPKGKEEHCTGRESLRDSFFFDVPDKETIVFGWRAAHAKFVNEGVPESEGRYVPAIGKKLVSSRTAVFDFNNFEKADSELASLLAKPNVEQIGFLKQGKNQTASIKFTAHRVSARRQIYKEAIGRGIPHSIARRALTTPIEYKESQFLEGSILGEFAGKTMSDTEFGKFEDATGSPKLIGKIRKSRKLSEGQKYAIQRNLGEGFKRKINSPGGNIRIATKQHKETVRSTERHELGHAIDHLQGRDFDVEDFGVKYWDRPSEKSARMWEASAGLQHGDIGTHPGQKAQHFTTKFMMELRTIAVNKTIEEIRRIVS